MKVVFAFLSCSLFHTIHFTSLSFILPYSFPWPSLFSFFFPSFIKSMTRYEWCPERCQYPLFWPKSYPSPISQVVREDISCSGISVYSLWWKNLAIVVPWPFSLFQEASSWANPLYYCWVCKSPVCLQWEWPMSLYKSLPAWKEEPSDR